MPFVGILQCKGSKKKAIKAIFKSINKKLEFPTPSEAAVELAYS